MDDSSAQINRVDSGEAEKHDYGAHPTQFGHLRLPAGEATATCVVLIHGGFWRSGIAESALLPMARMFTQRGYATWTVNYRGVADGGQ